MEVIKTDDMQGVLIIEPRIFHDACSYFFYSLSERVGTLCKGWNARCSSGY